MWPDRIACRRQSCRMATRGREPITERARHANANARTITPLTPDPATDNSSDPQPERPPSGETCTSPPPHTTPDARLVRHEHHDPHPAQMTVVLVGGVCSSGRDVARRTAARPRYLVVSPPERRYTGERRRTTLSDPLVPPRRAPRRRPEVPPAEESRPPIVDDLPSIRHPDPDLLTGSMVRRAAHRDEIDQWMSRSPSWIAQADGEPSFVTRESTFE